ncbi:PrpR N-terminal domain-containing protein [Enterococcus cecorum]|uniref:PrpR N-terminal domain-containing protein n=1 Tax=Enterococcus cecorum TaxID=44008 RepID=UPI002ACAFAB1|nr:PrpR N-terminal domain-containing protein [Enterococcus cecorum]MDZ5589269.1 PrpR N-terminal domain-containing protein [Enterococcus cecorum]
MVKLLGIAPYEELMSAMTQVSQQFEQLEIDLYTADLDEATKLIKQLPLENYDAIISRGGTAKLLRKNASLPVIDIPISIYDILGAIKLANNYTEHFAIIGFSNITEIAHQICDILQYNVQIITIEDTKNITKTLQELKNTQLEMLLCDVVTYKYALDHSMNAILITSGLESIKHSFTQAISLANNLKSSKEMNLLLSQIIMAQSQKILLFDRQLHANFSNIDIALQKSILHFLSSRLSDEKEQVLYHTHHNQVYQLRVKQLHIEMNRFFLCEVKKSTPPIINNSFGIDYLNYDEVQDSMNKRLNLAGYMQESAKNQIEKLSHAYNAMIIYGEEGTAKTSLAYLAYLHQKNKTQNLIVINSKLLNERTWKFLLNSSNGPLVETNHTFLFRNIEQVSMNDIEKLLTIIHNTKLLNKNNLLFTYNTKEQEADMKIFNQLMYQLDCCNVYSPSIAERKHELQGIITRLLNRMNIECNKEVLGFEPNALQALLQFQWTGNLHQLQRCIKKLVLNANGYYISENQVLELLQQEKNSFHVQQLTQGAQPLIMQNKTLFDYTQEIVLAALDQNNGNQTKTAKQLGISRTTLWRYLKNE